MTRRMWLMLVIIFITAAGWQVFGIRQEIIAGHVEFSRQGADIILVEQQAVAKVTVNTEDGQLVAVVMLGPGERQKIPLFLKWEPGKKYLFSLTLTNGGQVELTAQSPAGTPEKVSLALQAPYGLNSADGIGVVPSDSEFAANLLVTNNTDQPVDATLDMLLPAGIEAYALPDGLRLEKQDSGVHIVGRRRLSAKNEHWNEQVRLKAGKAGDEALIQATLFLDDGRSQWRQAGQAIVKIAASADISSKIRVLSVGLPVDAIGRFDPKARSGSLVYAPPSRLAAMTGTQSDNIRLDDEPFTYANIEVGNDGDQQVLVLVTGKIFEPASGLLAETFQSPPHKNAGLGYSYHVAAIAPHNSGHVILPIYLNENNVLAGSYTFHAEVAVFGGTQIIAGADKEMHLITRNDRPLLITLLMALMALIGIGWLLWRQEAALSRFSTKELVIISLFGTVAFVTVNMPQTILWDAAHVVFGPFSFLFTGFFSQTVLYALLMSLVVLLPRPGTVTLMIIVRMILTGFIFGHFTPVQILSYSALAVCLEAALYFGGATRNPAGVGLGRTAAIVLACGLVDVVTTYMNFMAYMTLYRLYYAEWYIGAVIAAGFAYTVVGAVVGCRLGGTLKRTAMD